MEGRKKGERTSTTKGRREGGGGGRHLNPVRVLGDRLELVLARLLDEPLERLLPRVKLDDADAADELVHQLHARVAAVGGLPF